MSGSGPGGPWPGARRILALGAVLGLLGVAAGAFGAHGLRGSVSPQDLDTWRTAAHYQQVHAVVLVALGLAARAPSRALRLAGPLLALGIVVFSGTLYAIVLGGPRLLGAVTPLGGLSLMAGWAALAAHALARPRDGG
ncbi:MAG: DUF423 domain-containing protein [Myxococcales bacterium]|nr:DUF423 domain-containing protein [Myxococcales bacterium]